MHPASAFDSVPRGASREGGNRPSAEQLEHPELLAGDASGAGSFARIAPVHLRAEIGGGTGGGTDSPAGVSPSSPRGFVPRPPRGPFHIRPFPSLPCQIM